MIGCGFDDVKFCLVISIVGKVYNDLITDKVVFILVSCKVKSITALGGLLNYFDGYR